MVIKTKNVDYISEYDIGDRFITMNGQEIELVIHSISINIRSKKFADLIDAKESYIEYHLYRECNGKLYPALSVDCIYIKEKLKRI